MERKQRKGLSKFWKTVIVVAVILVAVRLALPYLVLHFANKNLQNLEGYSGHIEDVDLALIKGEYLIKSFFIDKVDSASGEHVPFVAADRVGFSLHWNALLHGKIKGEVYAENPMVRFTKEKAEPQEISQDTASFREVLENFMPLQINRVEIVNGNIQYRDPGAQPPVDLRVTNLYVTMENLSNVKNDTAVLPSSVVASANVYGGSFDLNLRMDLLKEQPTFDMTAEVKNTDLTKFNDYFEAYGKFDVNRGTFGMYSEVAGQDGRFTGYVKPFIHDLDVVSTEDRDKNALRKLWEGVVGAVGVIFRNQAKDQIATKVPLEGEFENTSVSTLEAILVLLRNAFIQALMPAVDHEIDLSSVGGSGEDGTGIFDVEQGGEE